MARPRQRSLDLLEAHDGPIPGRSRPALASAPALKSDPVLVLDVRHLSIRDVFGGRTMGHLVWTTGPGSLATALYSYLDEQLHIHEVVRGPAIESAGTVIRVEHLPAFRGRGERPWFACPMTNQDGRCEKRALMLYLPSGEMTFRCRQCLGRDGLRKPPARLSEVTRHLMSTI